MILNCKESKKYELRICFKNISIPAGVY